MTSNEEPLDEGRAVVCRHGAFEYVVLVPIDGVVVLGLFWRGEFLWSWDEPAGCA